MLRNSKVHYKSSELYPILSMHFGESMNLARIKAMSLVICALCKVQRVWYRRLTCQGPWAYVESFLHHHDCVRVVLPCWNFYSRKHQTDKGPEAWAKGCELVQIFVIYLENVKFVSSGNRHTYLVKQNAWSLYRNLENFKMTKEKAVIITCIDLYVRSVRSQYWCGAVFIWSKVFQNLGTDRNGSSTLFLIMYQNR